MSSLSGLASACFARAAAARGARRFFLASEAPYRALPPSRLGRPAANSMARCVYVGRRRRAAAGSGRAAARGFRF